MGSILQQDKMLRLGLTALGRALECGNQHWFAGHIGAAMLSCAFILEESDLGAGVSAVVVRRAEDLVTDNAEYFQPFSTPSDASVDCAVESSVAESALLDGLARLLSSKHGDLSESGHGIIYAALALKALRRLRGELVDRQLLAAIQALLSATGQDRGDRYYGFEDYHQAADDYAAQIPLFASAAQALQYTLEERRPTYADGEVDGKYYYFTSEKLHGITHAHALYELQSLGYDDLAKAGLEALRKQFLLNRQTPPEAGPLCAVQCPNPQEEAFWRSIDGDPHNIKLGYALLSAQRALPLIADEEFWRSVSVYWSWRE